MDRTMLTSSRTLRLRSLVAGVLLLAAGARAQIAYCDTPPFPYPDGRWIGPYSFAATMGA